MLAKTFEIRDRSTFIVAVGVRMVPSNDRDAYLLCRSGYIDYSNFLVLLTRADGGRSEYDCDDWRDRTWSIAHRYIQENWDKLDSGAVVDVEYILGEREAPKISERGF